MIYGYARVSTDGQSVEAQVAALTAAGVIKVYRKVASGAQTDRPQLRQVLARLAAITGTGAGFTSLGDAWADTTTPHGRLLLTVLGGLAEFERELIRVRTSEGRARAKARGVHLGRRPKLTPTKGARRSVAARTASC
jgi:DNA invertase Pin-like site-specific DNA recombinase